MRYISTVPVGSTETQLESPASRLRESYRRMLTIRLFEERCLQLSADAIAGSIHLCGGQEAIPVGARAALLTGDTAVATYRGHGWAIEWGIPLVDLLAEICQRADGINGGRAGSPYLTAPQYGFIGENSIVGAGVPIATGVALAAKLAETGKVCIVSIGDGAMNQGATHEGLNFAAVRELPVIFVVENNGWSEMTPISETAKLDDLAERASAYGMPGLTVDGNDPDAVRIAVGEAAARARSGAGPTLIEAKTVRLMAHYNRDIEHYRTSEDKAHAKLCDPLPRLRARLLESGVADSELELLEAEIAAELNSIVEEVLAMPAPDPATARHHVVAEPVREGAASVLAGVEEMTFSKAVNSALRVELSERTELLVYGEDVGFAGGIFGCTRGLQKEFGSGRVFDTPISESAILGSAVGAATEGMRPVVEIMWADFMLVALDQLFNQAANVRYLTRGSRSVPLVVRTQQGATPGSCAQHSQSLEALLAHIPGLRVGMPSRPDDAYSMLRAAIADPDPTIVIEARGLYQIKGEVQLLGSAPPIGGAAFRRRGGDLAIISWGRMSLEAEKAGDQLGAEGIEATVLDLRWLAPLDDQALAEAVSSSGGRVLIVHEANLTGGFGAEVAARISERLFLLLRAPVKRVATPDVRIPSAPALQAALIPEASTIVGAARELISA
jgi:2-oxoisovalerate dehydrogenase E1 component